MSTPSGDLPEHPPTEISGQQTEPTTAVPHTANAPQFTAQAGKTNQLAIISLVAAIGSFFAHIIPGLGGATVAIVAIVTGFMARRQIKETGESGMGLATAGMVIGIIHLALIVLAVIGIILLIFVFGIALFGYGATHSSG